MKKLIYFLFAVLSLSLCFSCSTDSESELSPITIDNIVGEWIYDHPEEGIWEKQKFMPSGVFYYSNTSLGGWKFSNDTEDGRYFIEGDNRISMNVIMGGASIKIMLKILEITDYSYTAEYTNGSTSVGIYTYAKLLGSVNMKPEEKSTPDYSSIQNANIIGYSSHNEKVATIDTRSGEITGIAAGHTYIDVMTDKGTAVYEVIVFDPENMFEDYSFAFGKTIPEIVEIKGENYLGKDDKLGVVYYSDDYLTDTITYMTSLEDEYHVAFVQLSLNDNVSKSAIKSYLDSKYELLTSDNRVYSYITDQVACGFPIAALYNSQEQTLAFTLIKTDDLWPNYTTEFGQTPEKLKVKYGVPLYETDTSIYFTQENEYVEIVAFSFEPDHNKVYASSIFLRSTCDWQKALNYISSQYYYYDKGSDIENNYFAFTDKSTVETSNIGITFDGINGCITYIDLSISRLSQTIPLKNKKDIIFIKGRKTHSANLPKLTLPSRHKS